MTVSSNQGTTVNTLFKQGRWEPSLVTTALAVAETSGAPNDWINYLDICQAIQGATLRDWQHVANHHAASKRASPKLRLKLLNMILCRNTFVDLSESERTSRGKTLALSNGADMIAGVRDILYSGYLGSRLSHYPCLLASSESPNFPAGSSILPSQGKRRLAASRLQQLTLPFDQIIRQSLAHRKDRVPTSCSPSVAVVGNSPAILDSDAGAEIDSADLVIRFNNASLEPEKIRHTGQRTDIWVMSPSTPVSQCPVDARAVMVSSLHSLTRPSFFWPTLPGLDRPLCECPSSRWHELVACFKAPPSAGTLLLASLKSMNIDVQCHGFTQRISEHESRKNHHADNGSRSHRHNWEAEARWLVDCFPQRETLIVSSE